MRGQTVRDAMITRFQSLPADTSLAQAADLLLSSHQQDFPVTSQGAVVAVLTRADLVRGLAKQGARADVLLAAEREVVRLAPEEPLRAAVERMQAARSNVALVFDGDALAGMLTDENIGEFFQVHAIETPAE